MFLDHQECNQGCNEVIRGVNMKDMQIRYCFLLLQFLLAFILFTAHTTTGAFLASSEETFSLPSFRGARLTYVKDSICGVLSK